MAKSEKEKKKRGKGSFLWLMSVSALAVGLLVFCQVFFGDNVTNNSVFYENTHINGVDVSGKNIKQAQEAVAEQLRSGQNEIELTFTLGERTWELRGEDLKMSETLEEPLAEVMSYGREGNIFQKKQAERKIKTEGLNVNLTYDKVLSGAEEKVDEIIEEVERVGSTPKVVFNPDEKDMFTLSEEMKEVRVDREALLQEVEIALKNDVKASIALPFTELVPEVDRETLLSQIKLRSSFKTDYSTSSADRKHNVKKALSCFNGMIVEPGQVVSFNETTGPRSVENGYRNAKIIVGGEYIAGAGGGVCQASTTLYNALLLAGVDVLEANHHSLPASYVPLSFDAMVSESVSDLVFKNTLACPIYIKAYGNDTSVCVEIYGQKFEEGEEIRTRVELVRIIPHSGDKIVPDTNGEYSNRVLYKGEYYRLKYPREGYESKGYVQFVKNGKVMEEKMIRHDYYMPQSGIIMEGVEAIGEGMSVPASDVKIIPAQKVTDSNTQNVKKRIEKDNPSNFM